MSDSDISDGWATFYVVLLSFALVITSISSFYLLFNRKDIISNRYTIYVNDEESEKNQKKLVNLSIGVASCAAGTFGVIDFLFVMRLITGTDEYYDIPVFRLFAMVFLVCSKYCTWYLLFIRLREVFKPSIFHITPRVTKTIKYILYVLPVIIVICWLLFVITANFVFLALSMGVLFIFDLFFTAYIQGRFLITLNKILKLTSESKPIFIYIKSVASKSVDVDNDTGVNGGVDNNNNYTDISDGERNEYVSLVTKFAVLTLIVTLASLSTILSIVFVGIFGPAVSGPLAPSVTTCLAFDAICNAFAIILYFSFADKLYNNVCCVCHSSLTVCCTKD